MQVVHKTVSNSVTDDDLRLLTEKTLADLTDTSVSFWRKRRFAGEDPQAVRLGRAVRYRLSDVREWLKNRADGSAK